MASMSFWASVVLLALLLVSPACTFKAAVFEHAQWSFHASSSVSPEEIVRENLQYYAKATAFASSKGIEVIVFPEYGLFPNTISRMRMKKFLERVPDPPSNPCLDPAYSESDRPILHTLSCLARRHELIVVANMGDIQPCSRGEGGCPEDGAFHFNTNVAFDRDGRILAKYHKEHLFGEPAMDLPPAGQDPTFETHLGRFATFVCFDAVYSHMAETGRLRDVRAVLFSTMWSNGGPLFNSLQYFEAWAIGNNATLLAANNHLPGMSVLGSIIAGGRDGARVYTFNPDGHSKLLMADLGWSQCSSGPESSIYVITKDGASEWTDDGIDVGEICSAKVLGPAEDVNKDYRCFARNTSELALTRLVSASGRAESCSGGVCCTLEYEADELIGDFYLGVFNGSYNSMNRYFFAEEDCFLARCDGSPCSTFPTRAETLFRRVVLSANFSTDFVYPSLLESGMRLTPTSQWTFETAGRVATVAFEHAPGKRLLTVGLKARAFDRDPPFVK